MSLPPLSPGDASHRGRSVLSAGQRRLLKVVLFISAFMVANSLFLSSVHLLDLIPPLARPNTLGTFFQWMIVSHIFVGWILLLPALTFALWHLSKVWQRRHRRRAVWTGLLVLFCAGTLAFSGPFIQTKASSQEHRGMFWTHAGAALMVAAAYAAHRLFSAYRPNGRAFRRAFAVLGALFLTFVLVHVIEVTSTAAPARASDATSSASAGPPATGAASADRFVPFRPIADVPRDRLFFPAAATTTTLGLLPAKVLTNEDLPDPEILKDDMKAFDFLHRDTVGARTCQRCHPDIVEQWSRSAHRFSSFNNPFYRKAIEKLREQEGGFTRSKWCSSCHDPVLMLPGSMDQKIDPASAHAQAGLTCLACHQIDRIHNQTGNGAYNIPDTEPEPYIFAEGKSWTAQGLHDMVVKARPDVHKAQMLKPFFRTGEFCSVCHKVSLDVPVNSYRWFRGQNEYDGWYDSGVNHAAARTFYLPPEKKVCQDCHMPLEPAPRGDVSAKGGKVRSHRFLSVNTALPHIRGDDETIRLTEAFLRDEKLRIDIFALKRGAAAAVAGDGKANGAAEAPHDAETVLALDKVLPTLKPGETVEFHVVVRNKGVGHTFPGGTNDSNEGWIEFTVRDDGDRELYATGRIGPDGYLDPKAHRYHAIIVDPDSNPVHTRIPTTFRAMVYARVIGPSTSDVARFRFTVPEGLAGRRISARADLKWRKFDRPFTEFVFQGKNIPNLPVTTIASSSRTLAVGGDAPPAGEPIAASEWMRFNDYGIGLLLQGDTRAAVGAFREVARLAPEKADGDRNLARAALIDGNLEEATARLLACEKIAPGDPQTAFFWGETLLKSGRYDDAVKAYRRVLTYFPYDRQARFLLGRTFYLAGKFPEALEELAKVLEIDPEHREAHYHRMLAYRGLRDEASAAEAEKAYLKYQIDEAAQEFTRNFRLKYPEANFEAQRIHVHE